MPDNSKAWLERSWHWLVLLGVILLILGALYLGYGALDKKHRFLSTLIKSFLFGLTILSLITFGGYFSVLVIELLSIIFHLSITFQIGSITVGSLIYAIVFGLFCGLLIGPLLNRVSKIDTSSSNVYTTSLHNKIPFWLLLRKVSWTSFFIWMLFGNLCGLVLSLIMPFNLLSNDYGFLVGPIIGLTIGIYGGHWSKLLQQSKRRFVKLKRFGSGVCIGLISGLTLTFFLIIRLIIAFHMISGNRAWEFALSFYLLTFKYSIYAITNGIICGFIIGGVYAFGPGISLKLKNIPDRRFLQIGLVLTIVGTILWAIPSLIS